MMKPEQYMSLFGALVERNIELINSPEAFEHCHYLPRWYPYLQGYTPKSIWTSVDEARDISQIMARLSQFEDQPVIVKDWVKSRKHEWFDACYIPSAADPEAVERVVTRFLELQGDDLNVGLVFREFVEFEQIGEHSRSGMPLFKGYRIFYFNGKSVQVSRYWGEGDYSGELPPLPYFDDLASRIDSHFFTMDVAKTPSGEWMIMELGDGQVAALPDDVDPDAFFAAMVGGAQSGRLGTNMCS